MKRSAALQKLSREHHEGLVAARTLRRAAPGAAPLAATIQRFLKTWRGAIEPHFRSEEELLLPAFAQAVPADHTLIVRTLTEHVALRRAVRDLERADPAGRQAVAAAIGQALDDHIRFEERVLFPAIEAALAGPRLSELGDELLAAPVATEPAGGCPLR
jgi:hemerythrin-like domain-containing protein